MDTSVGMVLVHLPEVREVSLVAISQIAPAIALCFCLFCREKLSFNQRKRVGFGDICPGKTTFFGKLFLILFSLSGVGIFCGPIMDQASAWRHQIPGGLPALASFTIGIGVLVFSSFEGVTYLDAVYASVITGTYTSTGGNVGHVSATKPLYSLGEGVGAGAGNLTRLHSG